MIAGKPTIAGAERCSNCGRRSVLGGLCPACGHGESLTREEIVPSDPVPIVSRRTFSASLTGGRSTVALPAKSILRPGVDLPDDPWASIRSTEISGRVIILRQAPQEPMDFDPWRWVAIPVWGLVLLLTPVVVGIIIWKSSGFLAALGIAVVLLIVLRFMFSNRLIQSWRLTSALNGRHIVEPTPVLMVRLRQRNDREVQLRLKGQLTGGTLMEGDRIRAMGMWRAGVLGVRRVFCERTGAEIVPRQPNAFYLAFGGTCVLLIASLWLYFAGVPWVKQQANGFRSSLTNPIPTSPIIEFTP